VIPAIKTRTDGSSNNGFTGADAFSESTKIYSNRINLIYYGANFLLFV
jgi:hypothetical protein